MQIATLLARIHLPLVFPGAPGQQEGSDCHSPAREASWVINAQRAPVLGVECGGEALAACAEINLQKMCLCLAELRSNQSSYLLPLHWVCGWGLAAGLCFPSSPCLSSAAWGRFGEREPSVVGSGEQGCSVGCSGVCAGSAQGLCRSPAAGWWWLCARLPWEVVIAQELWLGVTTFLGMLTGK